MSADTAVFLKDSTPNSREPLPLLGDAPTLTQVPKEHAVSGPLRTVTHALATSMRTAASAPLIPGFEVLAFLGGGGMGEVYKVKKIGFNITYALKIIRQDRTRHQSVERFRKEAEAMTKLDHPHIVRVFEVGTGEDENPYLTMRLLPGDTLARRITEWQGNIPKSIELMRKICSAVSYIHQRGLLHRDIKPGNVLFDDQANPYLSDFGLVKDTLDGEATSTINASIPNTTEAENTPGLTGAGSVLGTPEYMSPEQLAGDQTSIGPPSDVFALGVMLHELIVGNRPSTGSGVTQLREAQEPRVSPSLDESLLLDPTLKRIILKSLAANPADRYANASELGEALANWQAPRITKRNRLLHRVWIIALGLLAAGALLLAMKQQASKNPENPNIADSHSEQRPAPIPGVWFEMLTEKPQTIVWPENSTYSRWNYEPENHVARVNCTDVCLLETGSIEASDYDLEVRFSSQPWVGGVGVFLGGRTENANGTDFFTADLLFLEHFELGPKLEGRIIRGVLNKIHGNGRVSSLLQDSVTIPRPQAKEHLLEISVAKDKPTRILWNKQEIPPILLKGRNKNELPISAKGSMGLYIQNSNVHISSVRLRIHPD